jgi:hypothetical protein
MTHRPPPGEQCYHPPPTSSDISGEPKKKRKKKREEDRFGHPKKIDSATGVAAIHPNGQGERSGYP